MSDERFKKIEDKIDIQSEKLNDINVTLVRNTLSLEEHVKRTNLLEEQIIPIKKHVDLMNALAKIFSILFGMLLAAKEFNLF